MANKKMKADKNTYCNTHEKRKYELENYLQIHKTLDLMTKNQTGKRLYDNFKQHNDCVYDTAIELGYCLPNIVKSMPKHYYENNPEKLKEILLQFINQHNRFPSHKEMQKELKINSHFISKFGGINEFKRLVNYDCDSNLIDVRGDYNKSIGEFIVANYFCSQGLADKYKREQYPFKNDGKYFRSDFTFYLDNKDIHVEVWGVKQNENSSSMAIEYHKTRKIKEDLYSKCSDKMILISINYEIFDKSYSDIQQYLYETFNKYVNLPLKEVNYNQLILSALLTDGEIYQGIMKISPDGNTFPTTQELKIYKSGLYTEILKRGYSYNEFANKFGAKLKQDRNEWTRELIFQYFDSIISSGKSIDKQTMNETYSGFSEAIEGFGYATKMKLEYFESLEYIPEQELNWVINLANNTTKTTANYTNVEVEKAKELLDIFHPNTNKIICCKTCGKEMTQTHIYEIYCKRCTDNNRNGSRKYYKPIYNDIDYSQNFFKLATEPYLLTTKGFNSVSYIKIQSYRNYNGLSWVQVVEKYGKFDELYQYVVEEYSKYITKTGLQNINTFSHRHPYITYDLVDSIGIDKIYNDCKVRKLRYSDEGYKTNFTDIVDSLGYIPLYQEFVDNTKINIMSYTNKFDLHKNVYDKIVQMYSSDIDYLDYLNRKKAHKTNVGKQTGKLSAKYSDEYLKEYFTNMFDEYNTTNKKYPSRREFETISKHDSSIYRKRYDKSWTEICEMYGYKTQQSI